MSWLTDKWHSVTGGSWRGLSDHDFWNDYDACIATTVKGRGNRGSSFEVWTYGSLIATRPTLQEAQEVVEGVYGGLQWEMVSLPPIYVDHKRYGPTKEFTDPLTLHVVRHLPKL
jgi:hypothetical protein